MAELSLPWDGTATGDAGTYTDDEWRDVLRAAGRGGGFVGEANRSVVGALLNSLAPSSPGNDQIKAETGYAIVDGTIYKNDAAVTKTETTPTVGTTGKRLVLQKDWTAQTVRLAVISSADGTATIPALTQTSGTKWEVPICSFTHATDGTIAAVTDEREFTNPTTIAVMFDEGGGVLTVGNQIIVPVPRKLHVYGWEILADVSGAIKVDVWSDTYANYPAVDGDSITGTDEPEITASGTKAQNLTTLKHDGQWTVDLVAKNHLIFNIDSVATITAATITLYCAG